MKKKIFVLTMLALSALNLQANAVEEVDLDLSEGQTSTKTLYGDVSEKEIYSMSNYAETLESAGASVDIITRKDIEKQGTPVLSELLNEVGSVYVENANGSYGSPSSVRMRGTDRVRMTIDGIRADRTTTTAPGIEPQFILSDDIERVEIVRGPHGNVGGTNASGGLIALQTRRGRGPLSIEMGQEMGNLGTFKERLAIMGGDHSLDYYMGLTWFKTDGGMRTSNLGDIRNDDYNNLNFVINLGKRLFEEKAEVRDVFRISRARKDVGVGGFGSSIYQDPNNYGLNYDIMNVLSFTHNPTERYNYDLKIGVYHNENNAYTLADDYTPLDFDITKFSSNRFNIMTQHNYKVTDWNTLSVGYNFEAESIEGRNRNFNSWGDPFSWKNKGETIQNDVYVNDMINFKDMLFIRGGARFISNTRYGNYVTPNASASLVLPTFKISGAKTKFRGSWGKSVNNPTLYQRFGILPGYLVPNPDLNAEKMQSWEVGATQSFFDDKLSFDASYFNSNYKDYIAYDMNFFPAKYNNVDRADIQGVEGKVTWAPRPWIKAVLSYTYTKSEDKNTHASLPGCPRNSVKSIVYWTPNDIVNLFAGIEANSGRYMTYDTWTNTQAKTNGYVDVKLGGKVRLIKTENSELTLNGVIYNLFDQNISMYQSSGVSYYSPGIHFRLGLGFKYTLPQKAEKEAL